MALLSGLSRECLTLAHHEITNSRIAPGTSGEVEIEFSDIYIKPGEYPLYFELTDSEFNTDTKDVIDDLTAPLVINGGDNIDNTHFKPNQPSGFFAVPSKIIRNEIDEQILVKAL